MDIYTKVVVCECTRCHSVSMKEIQIDRDRIKIDQQMSYNAGFNAGYKKAKDELREKLGLNL